MVLRSGGGPRVVAEVWDGGYSRSDVSRRRGSVGTMCCAKIR